MGTNDDGQIWRCLPRDRTRPSGCAVLLNQLIGTPTIMNLDTLCVRIARQVNEPLGIVEQVIKAALIEIRVAILDHDPVHLPDFGRFRADIVPATRDHPAYHSINFRAASGWRKELNRAGIGTEGDLYT